MNALGTRTMTALPGARSFNGSCSGYITAMLPVGASLGSGTLTCVTSVQGVILPGQIVGYAGSDGSQTLSSFAGAGGYAVTAGTGNLAVGSAQAPVAITLTMPDIGGSGQRNPQCMAWAADPENTSGSWQVARAFVNTRPISGAHMFGPEMSFCQQWTAANPGKTLYIIKASQGGSFLCNMPTSNDISPESRSSATRVFAYAQQEVALAEAALSSQLGLPEYKVAAFVYVQGEQDAQNALCSFPAPPFNSTGYPASASGPNVYQANLTDLIGRMAIERSSSAQFIGSIAGTVLTVASVETGTIRQFQGVSGAGVLPDTYVDNQIDGIPGGAGRYNLRVDQATGIAKVTVAGAGGVKTACGAVSGTYFLAAPRVSTSNAIKTSCVTGGRFAVGQAISGPGLQPGTIITALDAAGHTADGLYTVNVDQAVPTESMSAEVAGWGAGAGSARFVLGRTAGTSAIGVGLAQQAVNDNPGLTVLSAATVNTDDRMIYAPNPLHYDGRWYSEFGRRLYRAFAGTCDYHQPTC